MEDSVIHIPVPGGSGRIKTGPMAFEGDWPGFFFRGDELPLAVLRYAAGALRGGPDDFIAHQLDTLSEQMKSCIVKQDWPR